VGQKWIVCFYFLVSFFLLILLILILLILRPARDRRLSWPEVSNSGHGCWQCTGWVQCLVIRLRTNNDAMALASMETVHTIDLVYAVVANMIRLRFSGHSTAYPRSLRSQWRNSSCSHTDLFIVAPPHRTEALSDDARPMSVWHLSVCLSHTSGLSREQRGLGRLKLAQR